MNRSPISDGRAMVLFAMVLSKPGSSTRGVVGHFGVGLFALFRGLVSMITDPVLRRLSLVPIALTSLLYACAFIAWMFWADDALSILWTRPDGTGLRILWTMALVATFVGLLVVSLLASTLLVYSVAGVFYERMAAHALKQAGLDCVPQPFFRGLVADIGIAVTFAVPALGLAILSWIPGVGPVFAGIGACISMFVLAIVAAGPAFSVVGLTYRDRLSCARHAWTFFFGLGMAMSFILWIPLIGLVALPASLLGAIQAEPVRAFLAAFLASPKAASPQPRSPEPRH